LISKANTFSQIVLAGLVLAGLGLGLEEIVQILVWVTGTLTIVSAAAYFVAWLRHMASYEPEPEPRLSHKRQGAEHGRVAAERSRVRAS
jgi:cardiolipin synthase